jgi:hypothetical protein
MGDFRSQGLVVQRIERIELFRRNPSLMCHELAVLAQLPGEEAQRFVVEESQIDARHLWAQGNHPRRRPLRDDLRFLRGVCPHR